MKKNTKEKIKKLQQKILPITKRVLLDIAQLLIDVVDIATVLPHEYRALQTGGIEYVRLRRKWRQEKILRQKLYILRRRKYIATRKEGDEFILTLTNKGIAEVCRLACTTAHPCIKGRAILVVFDIPESERGARLTFRRFLKECGFTQYQKSVWYSERDVFAPLTHFIKEMGVAKWVSTFRVIKE